MSSTSNIHITGYWEGYPEESQDPFPLNQVPNEVNYIPIAFIMPVKANPNDQLATQWAFDKEIIYSSDQIKQWVADINNRGTNQKVLLSILDTPDTHWYPDVDIDKFAQNISKSVDEWGLGGIDVDAESGMSDPSNHYVDTFVNLIKSLRKYLSTDKIISYTCYTESSYDTDIIGQCKDDIDYINTMAYWNNTDGQISLYNHYVNDIGDPNKVGVGVKAGNGGDSTTIQTVKGVANWIRDNNDIKQKRMMLWSLTRDIQPITTLDDQTYLNTIYQGIIPNNNKHNKYNNYKQKIKQKIKQKPQSYIYYSPQIQSIQPPSPCIQPMNLSCSHIINNMNRSNNKRSKKYTKNNKKYKKNKTKGKHLNQSKEVKMINNDMIEITMKVDVDAMNPFSGQCTIL